MSKARNLRNISTESRATRSSISSCNDEVEENYKNISKNVNTKNDKNGQREEKVSRENENVNGQVDPNSDTEDDNYLEIDHAKEDDDTDETDQSSSDSSEMDDCDNIVDRIELIGDQLQGAFGSKDDGDDDSVIKSDEYFLAHSSKSKVSKESFATLLEKFDLYEADINEIIGNEHKMLCKELSITPCSESDLLKFYHLLKSEFNLLFYGYGSKRQILKQFADQQLKSKYHYVVIHGYMETIKLRDVITIMNKSIGNDHDSLVTNETELIDLMKDYFNSKDLYLLIHSIDVLYTKNVKIRNFLYNLFSSVSNVRILATVDHINSPLLWSLTEASTYRWLWFDMTTFEPYLIERKYSSSQSSIFSTGSKSWKQSTNLLAVKQVYNSVNSNAQKIFLTILKLYLESTVRNSTFAFFSLYLTCREEFLVNSEVTLREHLAEFKYHNLIKLTKASDGAESIQVTIDKNTVKRFMEAIEENEE